MPYDGEGIYRHYKGGFYEVLGVAIEEATLNPVVVYRPIDAPITEFMLGFGATMWTRPLDNFNEMVSPDLDSEQFLPVEQTPPMQSTSRARPRFQRLTIGEIMVERNERLLAWARTQLEDDDRCPSCGERLPNHVGVCPMDPFR